MCEKEQTIELISFRDVMGHRFIVSNVVNICLGTLGLILLNLLLWFSDHHYRWNQFFCKMLRKKNANNQKSLELAHIFAKIIKVK